MDIPNYRTLEKVGTGANSSLFHVQSLRTGQDYTVKYVKAHSPEDMKFIEQLREEYTVGSTVDHPVVRKVFELRYLRRRLRILGALLFMEYVDGIEIGSRDFQAPLTKLLQYFIRVAEGVDAMHRAGFVHADIKPGNILITPEDEVKLIDLGQSCRIMTAKSKVQGTIHYMAPEQANCEMLDARTDVFGLGAALYRVLTGKVIATEMNRNIGAHAPGLIGMRLDKLDTLGDVELPLCVAKLIDECCAREPNARLQDMLAFIEKSRLAIAILNTKATQPMARVSVAIGNSRS